MFEQIFYVLVGGGAGSIGRYIISEITPNYYKGHFPLATFVTNVGGCFIIGIFAAILLLDQSMDALLITGFCGGFTTFSTLSKETFLLLKKGKRTMALLYVIFSCLFGIYAFWGAYTLAERIFGRY